MINLGLDRLILPALIGGGVLIFLGIFAYDQRQRGAEKAVAKIEKVTSDAVRKADRAGARSRSKSGGMLDPYTIAD